MFGGSVYLIPYGWQGWVRLLVEKHVLELGDDGAKKYTVYIYIKKRHYSFFYIVDSDS